MSSPEQLRNFLSVVKKHNVEELDTARVYASGQSEELLGQVHASQDFKVSTKAPGFSPGSLAKHKILSNCALSLRALQTDKIDIYYFHGPDKQTPLEDQCDAIAQLHAEGKFARFGICNLSPTDVRTIHTYCSTKGYVLPSVYQGGYNPLHRRTEAELFPLLRELGMSFYAFSPLAGGLFAKPLQQIRHPAPGSRYDAMKVFNDIYVSEAAVKGITELATVCAEQGISVLEATLRWTMHHSALGKEDAVILGASTVGQIEESLAACEKGALGENVRVCFDRLWEDTKDKAPAFHF